ncbi:MAG: hypothetical protein ACI4D3_01345 [Lachnospiraceae bacterium]
MAEKKVVLVIVEGQSDKAAFGTIFEEYFDDSQVRFHVVNSDITTQDYITPYEIIKKINDILIMLENRYGYSFKTQQSEEGNAESSDYLRIIHITDTDGVFIPDSLVRESEVCKQNKKILYFADHMESHSKETAIDRNRRKAQVLIKLSRENKIHGIPYRIYYNSCNLEHVLFNILEDLSSMETATAAVIPAIGVLPATMAGIILSETFHLL